MNMPGEIDRAKVGAYTAFESIRYHKFTVNMQSAEGFQELRKQKGDPGAL